MTEKSSKYVLFDVRHVFDTREEAEEFCKGSQDPFFCIRLDLEDYFGVIGVEANDAKAKELGDMLGITIESSGEGCSIPELCSFERFSPTMERPLKFGQLDTCELGDDAAFKSNTYIDGVKVNLISAKVESMLTVENEEGKIDMLYMNFSVKENEYKKINKSNLKSNETVYVKILIEGKISWFSGMCILKKLVADSGELEKHYIVHTEFEVREYVSVSE